MISQGWKEISFIYGNFHLIPNKGFLLKINQLVFKDVEQEFKVVFKCVVCSEDESKELVGVFFDIFQDNFFWIVWDGVVEKSKVRGSRSSRRYTQASALFWL